MARSSALRNCAKCFSAASKVNLACGLPLPATPTRSAHANKQKTGPGRHKAAKGKANKRNQRPTECANDASATAEMQARIKGPERPGLMWATTQIAARRTEMEPRGRETDKATGATLSRRLSERPCREREREKNAGDNAQNTTSSRDRQRQQHLH